MSTNETNIELPNPEELRKMIEEEPEKLEELQALLNKQIIESAPERIRPRLKGLLFQMEGECRRHSNPLARTIALNKLMMVSLMELNDVLNGKLEQTPPQNAVILNFPK
jgi:hypothetical protein